MQNTPINWPAKKLDYEWQRPTRHSHKPQSCSWVWQSHLLTLNFWFVHICLPAERKLRAVRVPQPLGKMRISWVFRYSLADKARSWPSSISKQAWEILVWRDVVDPFNEHDRLRMQRNVSATNTCSPNRPLHPIPDLLTHVLHRVKEFLAETKRMRVELGHTPENCVGWTRGPAMVRSPSFGTGCVGTGAAYVLRNTGSNQFLTSTVSINFRTAVYFWPAKVGRAFTQ
jgi:hypothetical protein